MEKKQNTEEPKKVVETKEVVVEKKVETTVPTPPAKVVPVKKKHFGMKLLFWLIVLVVFGGGFTLAGVIAARTVLPQAEQWLIDHKFRQGDASSEQQNSPFLPQTSPGAKGSSGYTIPQIVKSASPSVVSIAVVTTSKNASGSTSDTIGTGFIVDANGVILTNQHVVSDTKAEYEVITQDNKTYKAQTIIRDTVNDIALIVVSAKGLPALSMGDSDSVEVGETVIAIGTPLGEFPGSVTVGVISGKGRTVVTGGGFWDLQKEYDNVLQTDAAVNPGNSGGPLLNLSGDVIGVNFATTGGADNISFALPINTVKEKLAEYRQYGKFRSPYLGVEFRMVTQQEATFYNVKPGALIRSITADSPASKSELKVSDIITEVNGKAVGTSLADSLAHLKVGEVVTLTVFRSDLSGKQETVTIKVTLGDLPVTK